MPYGKDLIWQTREPDGESQCFLSTILQYPHPPSSILSTCDYLSDLTPQIPFKSMTLQIQGTQSLCSFLGLVKVGERVTSSGRILYLHVCIYIHMHI